MTAYDEDEAPPPAAAQSPALQEFQDTFTSPVAKDWSEGVSARLNDYFTRRQIADDNTAAGENFVNDMDAFKSGLVSGVQKDPFFVHTALDIVPDTMAAFAAAMPNAPEGDHHLNVGSDIQREIAAAAVTSLAETHEGAARGMLGNERIKNLLGEATGPLDTYISAQAQARQIDHEAEVDSHTAHAALAADQTAVKYLSALYNPAAGTTQFPPGWNQAVLKDPNLPPPIKVAVAGVYDRLRAYGDVEKSDPLVIADAIRRAADGQPPPAGELLQRAGHDLTLADALALTRKLSVSPAAMVEARQMQDTLDSVRRQIAPPEYGAAGNAAYGRFVNWFVDEYGRQGPASLNPKAENWMLNPEAPGGNPLNKFLPNGDDVINVHPLSGMADRVEAKKPSLEDIFSRGRGRAREPAQHAAPAGYEYDASGSIVPTPVPSHPNTAPFYEISPLSDDQAINPAGTDRDAAGRLLTEVSTDAGIKALGRNDIARSTINPRPRAAPSLSEEEQREFQETGKTPARAPVNPRTQNRPRRGR